jgi:hypothetical protein
VWFSIGGAAVAGGIYDNGDNTSNVLENEGSGGAAARIDGATIRVKDSTVPIFTGSGTYARNDERIEYTGPQPTLAMVDFLAATPTQAFSVARRIAGSYAGPLIRVRRASDGATADIYPTSGGVLDEAAIATHCGVGVFGTIDTVYNQMSTGIGEAGTGRQRQPAARSGSTTAPVWSRRTPSPPLSVTPRTVATSQPFRGRDHRSRGLGSDGRRLQ